MPAIGKGVEEIRVSESSGAYRVIYLARRAEAVYVLHAFKRKRRPRPEGILKLRRDDSGNCWEEGYEQTRELCKCLGCDRGHP